MTEIRELDTKSLNEKLENMEISGELMIMEESVGCMEAVPPAALMPATLPCSSA